MNSTTIRKYWSFVNATHLDDQAGVCPSNRSHMLEGIYSIVTYISADLRPLRAQPRSFLRGTASSSQEKDKSITAPDQASLLFALCEPTAQVSIKRSH